jgi:hypothetical protein
MTDRRRIGRNRNLRICLAEVAAIDWETIEYSEGLTVLRVRVPAGAISG